MKNLIIALTLLAAAFGCDPIDNADHNRSARVRGYANFCVDAIWADSDLASFNGLRDMTHREIYEACAEDYETKKLVLIFNDEEM